MIKTYKYKLKLNKTQSQRLEQWLGVTRLIYNMALNVRIEAYRKLGKTVNRFDLQKELPEIKKEFEWVKDANAQSLQCVLKRLDEAYQSFFRGGGFPRFAKKGKWKSIEFPQNVAVQPGCRANGKIWLPKIGLVNYHKSRDLDGIIKTTKVVKEIDGWYICLSCERGRPAVEPHHLHPGDNQVGCDVGVAQFITTSDGEMFDNPKWFHSYSRDLRILQRSVARKERGSGNRRKAVGKLQKLHTKIKRKRNDHHHKLSTKLVKENQLIAPGRRAVEDLKLRNMTRSAKGTIEVPGKNVAQKRGLNCSLAAAARLILGQAASFPCWSTKVSTMGETL